jgi:hypothetical protein
MTVEHEDYSYSLAVNLIALTPNRTDNVLLGACYAPFEVHFISSLTCKCTPTTSHFQIDQSRTKTIISMG